MSDFLDAGRRFLSQNLRLFFSEREFFNSYACFQQLRNSEGESSHVGRLETAHAIATSRIPSWLCLEDVEVGKCQYGCVHDPDFRR